MASSQPIENTGVQVTPTKSGKKSEKSPSPEAEWLDKTPVERHRAMSWIQRLKRVFNIDIAVCEYCGGQVKVLPASRTLLSLSTFSKTLNRKPPIPIQPITTRCRQSMLSPRPACSTLHRIVYSKLAVSSQNRYTLPPFTVGRWGG